MKILILILDSENLHYCKLREYWRLYMKKNSHFDCYFLNSDPFENQPYIKNDTFYSTVPESLCPGVFLKTIQAFDFFKEKYDFIFRTNLSSFIVFETFYKIVETVPKENFCGAVRGFHQGVFFPSGAGYLFSKDVVFKVCETPKLTLFSQLALDDVVMGLILQINHISIQDFPRYTIENLGFEFENVKNHFHFRIKLENRELEYPIHEKLFQMFYS